MEEIEVRILEIDPVVIRRRLKAARARLIKRVFQRNVYYTNEQVKKEGLVVRLRYERREVTLCVKGSKRMVHGHKIREEVEQPCSRDTAKMLMLMGFAEGDTYEMRREYYSLKGCSVEILVYPGIPPFLELEGSTQQIARAAKLIGYSSKDYATERLHDRYGIKGSLLFKVKR